MYPLVIASIAVVAIFIERFNYYKKVQIGYAAYHGNASGVYPGRQV